MIQGIIHPQDPTVTTMKSRRPLRWPGSSSGSSSVSSASARVSAARSLGSMSRSSSVLHSIGLGSVVLGSVLRSEDVRVRPSARDRLMDVRHRYLPSAGQPAIWTHESKPSLFRILRTWLSAVRSDMNRRTPICYRTTVPRLSSWVQALGEPLGEFLLVVAARERLVGYGHLEKVAQRRPPLVGLGLQ